MMSSKHVCAVVLILSALSNKAYSMSTIGHMTQDSHPMLASVFKIADSIRELEALPVKQKSGITTGVINEDIGVLKPFSQHGINGGNKDHVVPATMRNIGGMVTPNKGIGMSGEPTFVRTADTKAMSKKGHLAKKELTNKKGKFKSERESTVIGIIADMICRLCRQRGDEKCIAIYCWNDGTPSVASGKQPPLVSQLGPASIPTPSNNLDLVQQIDRHDLLHNVNSQPDQNVVNVIPGNHPVLSQRENTPPIWMMSDQLLGTASKIPLNTVPGISEGIDLPPPFLAETIQPLDVTNNINNINNGPTFSVHPSEVIVDGPVKQPGPLFTNANLGNLVPTTNIQTETSVHGSRPLPTLNIQPLDIPSEFFIQMVRNGDPFFSNQLTPVMSDGNGKGFFGSDSAGMKNSRNDAQSIKHIFPGASDVFANSVHDSSKGSVKDNIIDNLHNKVGAFTRMPLIPTAGDIFPKPLNEISQKKRHQLVIQDHGNTEKVAIHVGNEPLHDNRITLLETSGQNANPLPTDMHPLDLNSLLQSGHDGNHVHTEDASHQQSTDHSHQNNNHQQSTDHTHQNNHHQHPEVQTHQNNNHQHPEVQTHQNNNHQHSSDHHSPMVKSNPNSMTGSRLGNQFRGIVRTNELQEPTTTTQISTINPIRKAELHDWSRQFLNGMNI